MKSLISFKSKFAKFFTATALAGAFLLCQPVNANAELRGFYARDFYVRRAPVVVVRGPYFARHRRERRYWADHRDFYYGNR